MTVRGDAQRWMAAHLAAAHGDSCELWPFSDNGAGYGKVWASGRRHFVHRIVCERFHGPGEGREAAHRCGVKRCVNPNHLRWATPVENAADRLIHGTHNRGEKHHHAVLTEDLVREMRRLAKDGWHYTDLAPIFGVNRRHVGKIVRGERWAHVAEEVES